ncbi:Uncharacterized protein Fot_19369 [Forsythia ovata]|uniref:Uncharacterized protein n=1 Tax=Forsythia ovata TaxID=205694 RepID=A0ABD1VMV6_9LAMI
MGSQVCCVRCRTIRLVAETEAGVAGCEQLGRDMTPFSVASNNSSTSSKISLRGLAFVLASGPILIPSVMSSQMCSVHCRNIRLVPETEGGVAGCEQVGGATDLLNTSSHISLRGLAFILASGPSKRGSGH